ncbi:MAG: YIP1 family protein [Bacteroidota bacterium]
MGFLDFWHKLVFHPKAFFSEDFNGRKSPYLFVTIAIYGMSNAMDRVDQQFVKADLRGTPEQYEWLNNWPTYWIFTLIMGAFSGYIFYLLGGWFYNQRIKWSKGTSNRETAKFLFLYPEFVPSLIYVLNTVIYMLGSPFPYDPLADLSAAEGIGLFLLLTSTYYSVYISYVGVTTATDVSPNRAKVWFLLLPIIFYTLAYGTVIGLMINYLQ